MAKKALSRGKRDFFKSILVIMVTDLFLLLFLKYKFNNLGLSDFSITAFGNLLNIGFAVITGVSFIIAAKSKKYASRFNQLPILILAIFSLLFHLVILYNEYSDSGVPKILKEIAPNMRVYYMLLFIAGQLIQFYLLALILSVFLGETKLLYLKAFFEMIFISIVLVLFSFFYSVLKKHGEESFTNQKYDMGVVLGAAVWSHNKPSPIFEGRIKKAYELYSKKVINKIQLTGSNAPGEKSEAKTASDYLKKLGVNVNDLFIEEKSSNTVEQVLYIKKNQEKKNPRRILIISDEFHLVRALEICSFFNVNAESAASEYNITSEKLLYYRLRESAALLLFWFFAV